MRISTEIFVNLTTTNCSVGSEHGSRGFENVPCSAHVPHIRFRTCSEHPGLLFSLTCGMPMADKRIQISEIPQFQNKMFTLLDFDNSYSQNRHIYHFHASRNPDTHNRGISNIKSGNVFCTCSAHFQLEQCSMPTKHIYVLLRLILL